MRGSYWDCRMVKKEHSEDIPLKGPSLYTTRWSYDVMVK